MDELNELVFEHDGALRRGDVPAGLERALVGNRQAALGQVLDEARHAIDDTLPSGLRRQLHRLRIRGKEIGGTDGFRELPNGEVQLRLRLVLDRRALDRLPQEVRITEIHAFHDVEARIMRPGFGAEPPVVLRRRGRPGELPHAHPQVAHLPHVVLLHFRELLRRRQKGIGGAGLVVTAGAGHPGLRNCRIIAWLFSKMVASHLAGSSGGVVMA